MKRTKQEKAITLIALIITIVVLLILAVVAINAVTGDGIIQHAVNAKTSYENAQAKEDDVLSYYKEYLDAKGDLGPWKQDGSKIYMTNSEDETIELKIGDIVNYKNESNVNYLDKDGNAIVWKVLGVENGRILLVSEGNVDQYNVTINLMYANGSADLNGMCSIYKNDKVADVARSINIEDVNKVTRYNPDTMSTNIEGFESYGNKITYTANVDQNGVCTRISFTATKSNSGAVMDNGAYVNSLPYVENEEWKTLTKGSITLTNLGYEYNGTELMKQTYNDENITNSEEYKLIFGDSSDLMYGLASRVAYAKASISGFENTFYFGIRRVKFGVVDKGGSAGGNFFSEVTMGVRSVIKLKESVELVEPTTVNGITTWNIK